MANLKELEKALWEHAPDAVQVKIRHPSATPEVEDSVEFHAVRLLLLLYHAGGPRKKRIDGRTKLAKLDFFVRYPTYLAKAARIKQIDADFGPLVRPESRMIRFKYGPWDAKYYNILAYLVSKEFIEVYPARTGGDSFHLTKKGEAAVDELRGPEFDELIRRCQLVYELFGSASGYEIKEFIYRRFPEIVGKPLGAEIEGNDA